MIRLRPKVAALHHLRGILLSKMLPGYIRNSWFWHYLETIVWGLLFLAAVALWLFVRRLPAWFRSIQGASWPMVEGHIESTTVSAFAEQSLAQMAYSYRVEGERYSGYFARQFADEQDAWDYIRPLEKQPIFVRYRPANPMVSAVRIADQGSLFVARETNFPVRFVARSISHLLGISDVKSPFVFAVRSWPLSKGRIESGTVTQKRENTFWYLVPSYVSEIGYSYSVEGEYYSGQIQRTFFREQSAQKFTQELHGKDVLVRYKPGSPAVSVIRRQDQQSVHLGGS